MLSLKTAQHPWSLSPREPSQMQDKIMRETVNGFIDAFPTGILRVFTGFRLGMQFDNNVLTLYVHLTPSGEVTELQKGFLENEIPHMLSEHGFTLQSQTAFDSSYSVLYKGEYNMYVKLGFGLASLYIDSVKWSSNVPEMKAYVATGDMWRG